MNQVKFVEGTFKGFEGLWSALGRPYHFTFFKGCLPQISLGPFLNTLSHFSHFQKSLKIKKCYVYAFGYLTKKIGDTRISKSFDNLTYFAIISPSKKH